MRFLLSHIMKNGFVMRFSFQFKTWKEEFPVKLCAATVFDVFDGADTLFRMGSQYTQSCPLSGARFLRFLISTKAGATSQ